QPPFIPLFALLISDRCPSSIGRLVRHFTSSRQQIAHKCGRPDDSPIGQHSSPSSAPSTSSVSFISILLFRAHP
ncbi:hypothetical protein F5X68DRAFT_272498, partial [Plectosphaerella plurivora]